MSFRAALVPTLVLLSGCGLLLDAGPPARDAGVDAAVGPRDAALDAPRDAGIPADAPSIDSPRPIDPPDAPSEDAGLDGRPPDGPPACSCPPPTPGRCERLHCEGAICVAEDDDALCDPGEVCIAGTCFEGCDACTPRDTTCETAQCIGRRCVRSVGVMCAAGQVCVDGRCAEGACVDPATGRLRPRGHVCRAAATLACEAAATCDGVSPVCPPNPILVAGTLCPGTTSSRCNPPRECDGRSNVCPMAGGFDWDRSCASMGGVCSTTGACLTAGMCTAAPCVRDCLRGTVSCTASPPTCVTRPDPAEAGYPCGTASGDCAPDLFCDAGECRPTSLLRGICRVGSGPCDPPDMCIPGISDCPPNVPAADVVCRPPVGECDAPELCAGSDATCPSDDTHARDGTPCGSRDGCQACATGACVPTPAGAACTNGLGVSGVCNDAGACVALGGSSCLVPGAPCAVGTLDSFGDCVVAAPAPEGTLCSPASTCVSESRCTGEGPSFACPAPVVGGTCTLDCGSGPPLTAPCIGARCPLVCPAIS